LKFLKFQRVEITMRIYLVEDIMYQTISGVHTNQSPSTNVVRFLDSFRLTK
jgi:hypothetical protein